MALRGKSSNSFLRTTDLFSFSEIAYDKEGNNVLKNEILKEALTYDSEGNLIRNKSNIAKILDRYGIIYRMIFNAMNMAQYTYDEVKEALEYLSDYINDLGVSGIIEFHAADKTQNSDHIHFWISSEEKLIYNQIAKEMVAMGYSNEEDVYIQRYEENQKIEESSYVNEEEVQIGERFAINPIGKEGFETVKSIKKMLSSLQYQENTQTDDSSNNDLIGDNIIDLLKKNREKNYSLSHTKNINKEEFVLENCSLPKTKALNSILLKIQKLKEERNQK